MTVKNSVKFRRFDYIYMFIMVIYMGQATEETSRMVSGLSGNPIPFLLPILLTIYLWLKHPVSLLNKKLWVITGIYLVWSGLSLRKYGVYTIGEMSYHFFMLYAIWVAYIQDAIYGYRLVPLYEKVIVWICKITTVMWLAGHIIPGVASVYSLFPHESIGNNVCYIFQWSAYSLRNAGCSWEPGRYAIMVCLGIYCNLCQHGVKFRHNKSLWWLLLSLASTMSTTGFCVTLVLFSIFILRRIKVATIFKFLGIMVPIIIGLSQLDFMQEKIYDRFDSAKKVNQLKEIFEWNNEHTPGTKYISSIDRFESMVFETMNIKADPILGYSRNTEHSYFYTHWSRHHRLAHGLLKVFGMYGLILGSIFYIILFKSSLRLGRESKYHQPIALFVTICLVSISYQVLLVPIFTAFWFFGLFGNNGRKRLLHYNQCKNLI